MQVSIKVPRPNKPGKFLFNSWKHGKCTCGLGYPLEEECVCGVQDKAKEFFRKRFENLNRQRNKVSSIYL